MEIGLMGLPLCGKTTIFNALTGLQKDTDTFSGKKTVNIADVSIPDDRVDKLSEIFQSKKTVYASVKFIDIQIEINEQGSFTSNFINQLKNTDALVIVLRGFNNQDVIHYKENQSPLDNLEEILSEMMLTDLMIIEKRLERLKREGKLKSDETVLLQKLQQGLESNTLLKYLDLNIDEIKRISGFCFLTLKPIIIVINSDNQDNPHIKNLSSHCRDYQLPLFEINGQIEAEIAQLPEEEQLEFLKDYGLSASSKKRFIQFVYKELNYISFLTTGEDETRAWTIQKNTKALIAAGKIHTDIQKGFIKAEVIAYQDLINEGNFTSAKKSGLLRLEGKEYIIKDGEIVHFRFNV